MKWILVYAWLVPTNGFRLYVPRTSPGQNITYMPFEPYERGFVGYFGAPTNYKRERINEGAPNTATVPNQFEGVHPRQVCPGMVGPLGGGQYYCRGKEYGYCDRRSGTCFCEQGYQGVDCGECTETHFQIGTLCYPKKLCGNDCTGHGNCNYTVGECVCDGGFWGEDCSQQNCQRFDDLCQRCSNTTCTTCAQGYSVSKRADSTLCEPCTRYDPRCSSCNAQQCLDCADPLLGSSRRSGYRLHDSGLLWDEQARQLSVSLPFGTQDTQFFDDAEAFELVVSSPTDEPLHARAKACSQGMGEHGGGNDASWSCGPVVVTHAVCGHRGTLGWASPSYEVSEGNGFLEVGIVRSGGGVGALEVAYSLEHQGTDDADVTATAPYTTSQTVPFPEGAVAMTFKVMIHDDRVFEGDERFLLWLHQPTGSSSAATLGPQRTAVVTIRDNDQPLTGWATSKLTGDFDCVAGQLCSFTVDAYSTTGARQFTGGDLWLVEVTEAPDQASPSPAQLHDVTWSPTGVQLPPVGFATAGFAVSGGYSTLPPSGGGGVGMYGNPHGYGGYRGGGGYGVGVGGRHLYSGSTGGSGLGPDPRALSGVSETLESPRQRRTAVTTAEVVDAGNGTYKGTWRVDRQGTYALHAYLAVGGGASTSLSSGGAKGEVYGDFTGGGAFAGGAASAPTEVSPEARSRARNISGAAFYPGGNGNGGLRGTYFDSPFLEPGTESLSRIDAEVNFTWGLGRVTSTGTDFVSVRWEGAVRPPVVPTPADYSSGLGSNGGSNASATALYTFTVVCDEGVRLWLNHELVIDQWHVELDGRSVSGTATLQAGSLSRLVLEYRDVRREAYVSLLWESDALPGTTNTTASASVPFTGPEVVPQAALYHLYELADSSPQGAQGHGYGGERGDSMAGGAAGGGHRPSAGWSGGGRGPQPVRVVSATTSASSTDCVGPGLFAGVAGKEHHFTIRPRDQFGNLRRDESVGALRLDPFQAEAVLATDKGKGFGVGRGSGKSGVSGGAPVTLTYDQHHSEFRGVFVPTVSGTYLLHVQHLSTIDAFADFHDPSSPSVSAGADNHADDEAWLFEKANNTRALPVKGSPFSVEVEPAPTFARRCKVWPSSSSSPPSGVGMSDRGSGSSSNAEVGFASWHAGLVQVFHLRAHDAFENLRLTGGDHFQAVAYLNRGGASREANLLGDRLGGDLKLSKDSTDADTTKQQMLPEVVYGSVRDHGGGNYSVAMRPTKKGRYTLVVTLLEQRGQDSPRGGGGGSGYHGFNHVGKSPYDVFVHHGPAHAASSVSVGRGLYTARATFPSWFTFQARDAFSNDLESSFGGVENAAPWALQGFISAPGASEAASETGTGSVAVSFTLYENGTALGEYTPRLAGACLLSVFLKTTTLPRAANETGGGGLVEEETTLEHISGSPFAVLVSDGPLEAATTEASGLGLRSTVVGQVAEFTVQARDPWGNARSDDGGDSGRVYSDGRLNYSRDPASTDQGSGLQGDRDVFNVTLVLVSELSAATTPAHRGLNYRLPELPTTFAGESTYLGNGLHRIRYNVTARGVYNLSVLASSSTSLATNATDDGNYSEQQQQRWQHISGSPFHPYAAPASSAWGPTSNVWGSGLRAQQVAGREQRLEFQSVDVFGNNLTSKGSVVLVSVSLLECAFNGSSGPAFSDPKGRDAPRAAYRPVVKDYGSSGRLGASFWPLVSGRYNLRPFLAQPGGLEGTYFKSASFTHELETRLDPELSFQWGHFQYNSPNSSLPDQGFGGSAKPKVVVPTEAKEATTKETIPPHHGIHQGAGSGHFEFEPEASEALAEGRLGVLNGTTKTSTGTAPVDYWSVRWEGFLQAPLSKGGAQEEVTLYVKVASETDSVAVFLDGRAVIGGPHWVSGNPGTAGAAPGGGGDSGANSGVSSGGGGSVVAGPSSNNGLAFQVHHPFTVETTSAPAERETAGHWEAATNRQASFAAAVRAQAAAGGMAPPTREQAHAAAFEEQARQAALRSEEEARAHELLRFAFPASVRQLSAKDLFSATAAGSTMHSNRNGGEEKEATTTGTGFDAPTFVGADQQHGSVFDARGKAVSELWATKPFGASLSSASVAAATATGRTDYATALLFPRPHYGEGGTQNSANKPSPHHSLHTFEVVYRHLTGQAGVEVSWSSPSMTKRVIPPSSLFRPQPLGPATYPLVVEPAPTHPRSSTALGPGVGPSPASNTDAVIVAGAPQRFTIEARDEYGNLRLKGGDVVSAVGTGPGSAHFTADVADKGDGTYEATYYALSSGSYSLSVTVGSSGLHRDFGYFNVEESLTTAHVVGSPFRIQVVQGNSFGPACACFGEGTFRAGAGAGVGGRGGNSTAAPLNAFSPFSSSSSTALAAAPAASRARARALEGSAVFTIVSRDQHHNKLPSGGDAFDVKLVPVSGLVDGGVPASGVAGLVGVVEEVAARTEVGQVVSDKNDGTYQVAYSSAASGFFDLHVRLRPRRDRGLKAEYFQNRYWLPPAMELEPRSVNGGDGGGPSTATDSGGATTKAWPATMKATEEEEEVGGGVGTDAHAAPVASRVEDPPAFSSWASSASLFLSPDNWGSSYDADLAQRGAASDVRRAIGGGNSHEETATEEEAAAGAAGEEGAAGAALSARWLGFLSVPTTGDYNFTVRGAYAAARLTLDGELLVSTEPWSGSRRRSQSQAAGEAGEAAGKAAGKASGGADGEDDSLFWEERWSRPVHLEEGRLVPIVVEASNRGGVSDGANNAGAGSGGGSGGAVEMWWLSPRTPLQAVPSHHLHPPHPTPPGPVAEEASFAAQSLAAREASLLGGALLGSPFRVYVSPSVPFAPHCVASGRGRTLDDVDGQDRKLNTRSRQGQSGGALDRPGLAPEGAWPSGVKHSRAHGYSSLYGYANETATLLLTARDVFGNTLDGQSSAEFYVRVVFNGPYASSSTSPYLLSLKLAPQALGNGSYAVTYVPGQQQPKAGEMVSREHVAPQLGDYTIDVRLMVAATSAVKGYGLGGSGANGRAEFQAYYYPDSNNSDDDDGVNSAAAAVVDNGGGGGLTAEYYTNPWMEEPALAVRVDATVDLVLAPPRAQRAGGVSGSGGGALAHFGQGGDVSVRWSGFLKAPLSDLFTFSLHLGSGGGGGGGSGSGGLVARLFLDGELVLDTSADAYADTSAPSSSLAPSSSFHAAALEEGVLYQVRVEFEARSSSAEAATQVKRCALLWSSPRTPRQPVPPFFLYPLGEPIDGSPLPLRVFAAKPPQHPTPTPTPLPTPSPTGAPTEEPTSGDTVGFAVELGMTAASETDLAREVVVPALAGRLGGASVDGVKDYEVAFLAGPSGGERRRRRRPLSGGGLLLSDWAVKFEVFASLGALGFVGGAPEFGTALENQLAAAVKDGSLQGNISAACNCSVEAFAVATPEPLRTYPTKLPTSLPSSLPSSLPTALPSSLPSTAPTSLPSDLPTSPSELPSLQPTSTPTSVNATATPTSVPST